MCAASLRMPSNVMRHYVRAELARRCRSVVCAEDGRIPPQWLNMIAGEDWQQDEVRERALLMYLRQECDKQNSAALELT